MVSKSLRSACRRNHVVYGRSSPHRGGYYSPSVTEHEPPAAQLDDDWPATYARLGAESGLHTIDLEERA